MKDIDVLLDVLLALPLLAATIVYVGRLSLKLSAWVVGVAAGAGLLICVLLSGNVLQGNTILQEIPWLPEIGLYFILQLDGLTLLFSILITGIGALIALYAAYYIHADDRPASFFSRLAVFMGAMLGLVLSGDLVETCFFWELTSISSFLLIGFWSTKAEARQGASTALIVTVTGGFALLAGVLLLGRIVGDYRISAILQHVDQVQQSRYYTPALLLILTGIFTKSGQFPFHFWLPRAMAAPTPISAYLHSATMVKAGIFLLARLYPVLSGTTLYCGCVTTIGAITMANSAWQAVFKHDLKGLLAYSTLSNLGLITLLYGLSTPLGVVAATLHFLNHAIFKSALFMSAGIIDHQTGSRDMRKLSYLGRSMPITSALAIIAALAMAGVPLFNGFISKELFFSATQFTEKRPYIQHMVTSVALFGGALTMAYSIRFIHDAFLSKASACGTRDAKDPSGLMVIPVLILAILCLGVGVAPQWVVADILHGAVHSILNAAAPDYSLALWHGFGAPVLMSIISVLGGVSIYIALRRRFSLHHIETPEWSRQFFDASVVVIYQLGSKITKISANGSLQRSLICLLASTLIVAFNPWFSRSATLNLPTQAHPMPLPGWIICIFMIACAIGTAHMYRQRFKTLTLISGVGCAMVMAFIFFSGPDVALTQLLTEMITLALFLLTMTYLPEAKFSRNWPIQEKMHLLLGIFAGVGMSIIAYHLMQRPRHEGFVRLLVHALGNVHAFNLVNGIIVNLRALDTLCETTVFVLSALIVHAVLRKKRLIPETMPQGGRFNLPIPADLTQILFPLTLTVSIYLFMRGPYASGGGFIAGLVLVIPLLTQYMIQGRQSVQRRFGFDYIRLLGLGLLLVLVNGLLSIFFDAPFLSPQSIHINLPIIGSYHFSTEHGFDLGVYASIFSGTLLILTMIGNAQIPEKTKLAHQLEPQLYETKKE